ncbi:hypothetical protein [Burkholderia sp. HI2714]|uniref:hypothetical protein n=1 Tax=Burkholderia sp. HI2714 TaxID=2015359 RepID=UPI00118126DB|nr:hypothetical protein [Burkholderia sp. HI2714]
MYNQFSENSLFSKMGLEMNRLSIQTEKFGVPSGFGKPARSTALQCVDTLRHPTVSGIAAEALSASSKVGAVAS